MAANIRHLTRQESEPFFLDTYYRRVFAFFPDASQFSRAPSLTLFLASSGSSPLALPPGLRSSAVALIRRAIKVSRFDARLSILQLWQSFDAYASSFFHR